MVITTVAAFLAAAKIGEGALAKKQISLLLQQSRLQQSPRNAAQVATAMQVLGDEPVKFEHLAKFTCCMPVVKENLRLFPPLQSFTKCRSDSRSRPAAPYTYGLGVSLPSGGVQSGRSDSRAWRSFSAMAVGRASVSS